AGGEVQIGKQDQVGPQVAILRRQRLLHLHDHLSAAPGLRGGADSRADAAILAVADAAAQPRAALDPHLMPARDQCRDAAGRDCNTLLLRLDLPRNADAHFRVFTTEDTDDAEAVCLCAPLCPLW